MVGAFLFTKNIDYSISNKSYIFDKIQVMNILEEANNIVFKRAQEKDRQYGSFSGGMERMSKLASIMCDKQITVEDCYKIMIALKLSRESYNKKYDNLLDAISYMAAMQDHFKDEYEKTK
jgi:hypothetical protein